MATSPAAKLSIAQHVVPRPRGQGDGAIGPLGGEASRAPGNHHGEAVAPTERQGPSGSGACYLEAHVGDAAW